MTRSSLAIVLAAAAGLLPPCLAQAQNLDAQRPQIQAALQAAESGRFDVSQYPPGLTAHPLYGWVEFADLKRDIDTLPTARAQSFLKRYEGQAVADAFRGVWLPALSRRQDWPTLRAAWKPTSNVGLQCAELNARQALGKSDAQWTLDAQKIWTSTGKSLPDSCDPVFALLGASGGLTPALRWERIDKAAAEQQTAVMRSAARGLPPADAALANDYAAFLDGVHARALGWPKTERSRKMAMYGLMRLAKSSPASAEMQLPQYAAALGMSESERGKVLYEAALWTVASYEPDSARRLNAVPEAAYDEKLHEWRVREAMARGDWRAALAAIRKMPKTQREDSRWRYFEARLAEKTGDNAEAQRLFREAAKSPTFHGFLAADRVDQGYALCAWIPNDSAQARAAIAKDPAIVRAMELWKLERPGWATSEWNSALARFDDTQRRLAVEVARDNGWFDRAVFSLGKNPEEQRLYELRFPLHHGETIKREAARNAIDPAWVAAEIRAESIFNPKARSGANAMGLMQVLPSTGAATARSLGVPWGGANSLYDSDTNIMLGTAYLRQMENKYGTPYVAIAAYNAGPAPTARWQSQRPNYDPDFWIETISYKETREYVARVLAFSVIYDWRLNGKALPVTDRMLGRVDAKRKSFSCPTAQLPKS
ncbi:transglycosylase SLT domain-containing protein [Pseudoxanthomonas sacheonensis]|uniref:transglycosylase SLT domain-containing protein n=1 Tax=Pseudoxanthomonas sacheonensis TaxID=443615 RepID=UPI0013D8B9A7|nr:transglycosylase SLT domain-containing protein [Pseudoxanthomonas sacheonensis]KAF1707431.1 lytic murein transglycosylase [Pseudoxanthomonas sacheonensis]